MAKIETTVNWIAFFVDAAGELKSKLRQCFKKLKNPSRQANVHYFWNPKSWVTSQVMDTDDKFQQTIILFCPQTHVSNESDQFQISDNEDSSNDV